MFLNLSNVHLRRERKERARKILFHHEQKFISSRGTNKFRGQDVDVKEGEKEEEEFNSFQK